MCGTDFDELTLHPEPKKKVDAKKKIHGPTREEFYLKI
jgi:hypothetical protein